MRFGRQNREKVVHGNKRKKEELAVFQHPELLGSIDWRLRHDKLMMSEI